MSIDLSRPQTQGSNPQDALDGYVTFRWLSREGGEAGADNLEEEILLLRSLLRSDWTSADPLGIGGLLFDAFRLSLLAKGRDDADLIAEILAGSASGFEMFLRGNSLVQPADYRLGFRELGLAIGLQTLPTIHAANVNHAALSGKVDRHLEFFRRGDEARRRIIAFWSEPENRSGATWQDHLDINEVMLATALLEVQLEV